MRKFSIAHQVFLAVFILLLNGCGGNGNSGGNPDVQVNELSNSTTSYDEIVHINNCGGKGESEQTKSRSFSTNIEGGIDIGVQQVVEAVISTKYSQSRNVSVSQSLVAPGGTNMEFVLRWKEDVHAGNVIINGETGTYTVNIPIAVEQVSGQDLGCSGNAPIPPSATQSPINTAPPSSSTDCSQMVEGVHHSPTLGVEWKFEPISENRIIHIWSNHWSNNLPEYKFFLPAGQSVSFMSGGGSFWTEKVGCNGVAQVIYDRDSFKEISLDEYQKYITQKTIP